VVSSLLYKFTVGELGKCLARTVNSLYLKHTYVKNKEQFVVTPCI
jgi:hypothetical protein